MRLIDADAFKDYIRGACEDMKHLYKDNGAWAKEITESFCKDIDEQPTIQPEIVRCKDCKYWHSGSCECREHAVNCQDYYVGDIETEAEYFCGYAKRKEVTT